MVFAVTAFEPGQEMAIANFFLAIFFVFTICLPLLLITRGDKTKGNRDFLAATVNPWAQSDRSMQLTPVVVSGLTPDNEVSTGAEMISEKDIEDPSISGIELTSEVKDSNEPIEYSPTLLIPNDEVLAA